MGAILGLNDGPIDLDGNAVGTLVGVRLILGSVLGVVEGSTDNDGVDEG